MNKKDVEKQVIKWMEEDIQSVLSGKVKTIELLYVRPNDIISYINTLDKILINFDSNGYQWDYWIIFTYNNKNYKLTGDGYYNNSAILLLNENF